MPWFLLVKKIKNSDDLISWALNNYLNNPVIVKITWIIIQMSILKNRIDFVCKKFITLR